MKITLLGNGGMGQAVHRLGVAAGHEIVVVDPHTVDADYRKANLDLVSASDMVVDCSLGEFVPAHVELCVKTSTNMVVVTTGWYDKLPKIQQTVTQSGIGFLWSSNFSIGVNMYFKIVEAAAKLANRADNYDVWAHEIHHVNKLDAPSGTAKQIGKILLEQIDRKRTIVDDKLQRSRKPHEIHISSVRGGSINFGHWVGFESATDSIVIKHTARNREGFAFGAIKAAEWLLGKNGYFEMDDFLKEIGIS